VRIVLIRWWIVSSVLLDQTVTRILMSKLEEPCHHACEDF
jgi:hypothetical protein